MVILKASKYKYMKNEKKIAHNKKITFHFNNSYFFILHLNHMDSLLLTFCRIRLIPAYGASQNTLRVIGKFLVGDLNK